MNPLLFRGLLKPPKGLLLFGPPGTGKTLIGKAIAKEVKATFYSVSVSTLTSKWVGEGEKLIRCMFELAKVKQPSVIFLDEVDALLSQRSKDEDDWSRRSKNEFLSQLDGVGNDVKDDSQVLFIGATNRPHELDDAARRRLEKRMQVPLPGKSARKTMIQNLMAEQKSILQEKDLDLMAEKTQGQSGMDMNQLCRATAVVNFREQKNAHPEIPIPDMHPENMDPILIKHLEEAKLTVKPTVASDDIQPFIDWNNKFGSFEARNDDE